MRRRYKSVYAAVGVHPHDAKLYDDKAERHLIDLIASTDRMIAWGEIGLDFYYDHSPRDVQERVFRRQIRKACELGLPIIIHSRDADDETVDDPEGGMHIGRGFSRRDNALFWRDAGDGEGPDGDRFSDLVCRKRDI